MNWTNASNDFVNIFNEQDCRPDAGKRDQCRWIFDVCFGLSWLKDLFLCCLICATTDTLSTCMPWAEILIHDCNTFKIGSDPSQCPSLPRGQEVLPNAPHSTVFPNLKGSPSNCFFDVVYCSLCDASDELHRTENIAFAALQIFQSFSWLTKHLKCVSILVSNTGDLTWVLPHNTKEFERSFN